MIAFVIEGGTELGELVRDVLEDAGWRVEIADDGIAAVGRVRRLSPDVILLDGAMAAPVSVALLGALRSLLRGRPVPLLAFGDVTPDVRARVDGVLPRSLGRDELLEAISALDLGATTS